MPFDFSNAIQPIDTSSILLRLAQLKSFQGEQQDRAQLRQMNAIKLRELAQQEQDQQAMRGAYGAAAQQGRSVQATVPSLALGNNTLPATTQTVRGPGIDNSVLLQKLAESAPQLVPGVQDQIQQQEAARQEQMLKTQQAIANIAKTQGEAGLNKLQQAQKVLEIGGQVALGYLNAPPEQKPQAYQQYLQRSASMGADISNMPQQWTPEVDKLIQQHLSEGQSVKDYIGQQLTKRGQDMTAATAKAGQEVTMRGQNMTDARSREQNQIARETKLEMNKASDENGLISFNADMDRLAAAANELKNHPGLGGITGKAGAFPNIPGGQAANAQAKFDTLKSQIAFATLQNLRNNSKTGGALGQVSDREEKMLASNIASLEKSQSKEELQKSLQKIIDYTAGAKNRADSAIKNKYGAQKAAPAATTAPAGAVGIAPGSDGKNHYHDASGKDLGVAP